MSTGYKQYLALRNVAIDNGADVSGVDGYALERFIQVCQKIIEAIGGTFTPVTGGTLEQRKANALHQLALANGSAPELSGTTRERQIQSVVSILQDNGIDYSVPRAAQDWRLLVLIKLLQFGPADQDQIIQWLINYDGPIDEWTDKVAVPLASPESVDVPVLECNNVNTRIRTFKKWDGVSVLDFTTYCYPTTFANVGYLISDRLSSTARNLAIAVLNSSGTLSLQVQTSTGFQSVSGPALSLNTTHKVRATIDTATGIANMWLDDVLVIDSHVFTGTFSVANEFIAGGQWPAGSSSFGGYIWGSKLVNHFDYTLSEAFGDYVSDIQRRTGNHATISQKLTLHPYVDDVAKEVVHPDIYIFDEPWNGWTHWMVYTPYASSNNQIENPSIEVSNDGITWQTPAGLTNPIVGTPVGASDFNSDPELMFDDGKLKIIYRETLISTSIENMKYTESSDGITWSATTTIFSNAFATERPLSHTIAWNGSEWFMLYWDLVTTNFRYRTSSALDTGWSSSSPCVLTNVTTNPWHQKMRYINNEYVMYSQLGGSGGGELVLIKSTDGINWDYSTATTLIRSTNSELARNAYRSTFWPSDETGITYRSWFGEANNPWGIYYGVYGELGNFGRVENGSWGTLDGIEDKSRSNGYSVVRDGSGDAIGPFVPPLDGELIDSQGLPIGVVGSEDEPLVHNGGPAGMQETDANFAAFSGANLMGNGVDTWNPLYYADYTGFINGTNNVWIQWWVDTIGTAGACIVKERIAYPVTKVLTAAEYNQTLRWAQRYTSSCGNGVVPFEVFALDADGELAEDADLTLATE
jgi:hypothetical protein